MKQPMLSQNGFKIFACVDKTKENMKLYQMEYQYRELKTIRDKEADKAKKESLKQYAEKIGVELARGLLQQNQRCHEIIGKTFIKLVDEKDKTQLLALADSFSEYVAAVFDPASF